MDVLLKLRDAIRKKNHPNQLVRGVLLHHDNARPHTAQATQERFQELQLGLLERSALQPGLGALKNHLGGKRLADNEDVETEVRKWLKQPSKDFHAAGFDTPVKRWNKRINVGG
jgi:hypothetical protein